MSEIAPLSHEPWLTQQLLEANPSGVILVDALQPDMPIIYVNSAFEKLTGYHRSDVIGRNCRFLQGNDRDQPQIAVLRKAIREQTDANVTLRNYRKDGTRFWNELRISPIRDQHGIVTHYIGIQNDITERVETENALHEFGLRYHALFSGSFNAVFIHDFQGSFIDANDTALALFDYTRAEIPQLNFATLLEAEDLPRALSTLQEIIESGTQKKPTIFRVRTRSGELKYVETMSSVVYRHGSPWMVQGIARDITDQQHMEDALRESETRLRAMIEASPDLIFRVHRDGTHLDYHAPSEDLLAVSPSEFLGKNIRDVLAPDMADTLMHIYEQVLLTRRTHIHEYTLKVPSGLREFEARIMPSGEDETVTFVRDVTAVRQAERQAIALQLEQERTRLLTEFIKNASHEFLTPLAIINSSAALILRASDPEVRRQKAEQISLQVSQITKLVDMLLMMVTLETLHPDKDRVDVNELLNVISMSFQHAQHTKDRFRSEIEPNLPAIMGYEKQLRTAVRNLLENAERYSEPDAPITLRAYSADGHVVIEIKDDGVGISADSLPHIFDTFWRQDEAHTTSGFGLGLSIVRKVIDLHDGEIEVESELGKGSVFRIHLPAASPVSPDP